MLEEVLRRGNGADLLSYWISIDTANGRDSIKLYFVYIWMFCIPSTWVLYFKEKLPFSENLVLKSVQAAIGKQKGERSLKLNYETVTKSIQKI